LLIPSNDDAASTRVVFIEQGGRRLDLRRSEDYCRFLNTLPAARADAERFIRRARARDGRDRELEILNTIARVDLAFSLPSSPR
jgi:hypothetical protein